MLAVTPFLQALWLADEISQDSATGKVTVRGIFDQIEVDSPATHFTCVAYLFFAVRNVHRRVDLVLRYVDLSTNEVLLERPVALESDGPLATTDVSIHLPRIPVPHSGEFAWELYCGNDVIGVSRVIARVNKE